MIFYDRTTDHWPVDRAGHEKTMFVPKSLILELRKAPPEDPTGWRNDAEKGQWWHPSTETALTRAWTWTKATNTAFGPKGRCFIDIERPYFPDDPVAQEELAPLFNKLHDARRFGAFPCQIWQYIGGRIAQGRVPSETDRQRFRSYHQTVMEAYGHTLDGVGVGTYMMPRDDLTSWLHITEATVNELEELVPDFVLFVALTTQGGELQTTENMRAFGRLLRGLRRDIHLFDWTQSFDPELYDAFMEALS